MSEQIPVRNITPPPAKGGESVDLYASREKIYTRAFTGLFRNLRLGAEEEGHHHADARI